jgi:hypothetical protein
MVWERLQPYSQDMMDGKRRSGPKKARKEPIESVSPENSPMSPERAFVVQFRTSSKRELTWFAGRAEHMMSGQSTGFETPQELVEFFGRVMNQQIPPTQRSTRL